MLVRDWSDEWKAAFKEGGLPCLSPQPPPRQLQEGEQWSAEELKRVKLPLQLETRPCFIRCDDRAWSWVGESEVDPNCTLVHLKRTWWPKRGRTVLPHMEALDFFHMELKSLEDYMEGHYFVEVQGVA